MRRYAEASPLSAPYFRPEVPAAAGGLANNLLEPIVIGDPHIRGIPFDIAIGALRHAADERHFSEASGILKIRTRQRPFIFDRADPLLKRPALDPRDSFGG